MKVIIAGHREFSDYALLSQEVLKSGFEITEVISGCARGADTLGEQWAVEHGIPVQRFPADWNRHGKAAGPIRNGQMAAVGEALIAFLAPESRGTADMIRQAKAKGLPAYVVHLS